MGWGGLISTIAGGVEGTVKGITGLVQASRGNKQLNTLLANRPVYNISQGYQDAYKTYQALANSNLPGYDIMKGQIDQSGARTMQNLERGAMSSNQLMSGALSSQDKELDAIKNLGLMSAQWRGQQQQNLAEAQNKMGGLQDQAWDYNVSQPWGMKANMASEMKQAGWQNFFGGLSDIGGNAANYAGTSALLNYYKGLQGQQGQVMPQNQQSQPLVTPSSTSSQDNLNSTLGNMFTQWQSNNGK
jgi:hypothetical protein